MCCHVSDADRDPASGGLGRAEENHLTPVSRIEGLSLSPSTCAALEKGLQMDPMERYPDIGALMKVLYPAKRKRLGK